MKNYILKLICIYFLFLGIFILQKVLFLGVYQHLIHASAADWIQVILHGSSMDRSVAGYLSIIPALTIIAGIWLPQKWVRRSYLVYSFIAALAIAVITLLDLTLYGYWGFRLDMTPIFYFTTSPSAAMASAEWWHYPLALIGTAVITLAIYKALAAIDRRYPTSPCAHRGRATAILAVLTALLFIPIRGGFTVSTMNLSRAYFSNDQRLNHAAINPLFSLLYSATHQDNFARQYRDMDPSEAAALMDRLNQRYNASEHNIAPDSTLLSYERPHIYLIILESFSSHLLPSLGGEPIAVGIDSIASKGISFTNIYASSFRTDRGLPAILSGFPGQPSMSLMKYVEKTEKIPSLAASLKEAGYNPAYYYGGDINFTNMNAYLVNSGFSQIISDKDFPLAEKTGKWGAQDHSLFARVLRDVQTRKPDAAPEFNVIQTSSSHEPFEVPFTSRFADKRANAFAYTDSCVTSFVNTLAQRPDFDRTLIVMVPDHYGAYPDRPEDPLQRHRIPLIIAGGAINANPGAVTTVGSQTDIAATLLTLLGLDSSRFEFSHDLLSTDGGYAFFSEPGLIGLVTPTDTVVYDCDARCPALMRGIAPEATIEEAKAYLQTIYSRIADL